MWNGIKHKFVKSLPEMIKEDKNNGYKDSDLYRKYWFLNIRTIERILNESNLS